MLEKTPENNTVKIGKPLQAGVFRFKVLEILLVATTPLTIEQIRCLLVATRIHCSRSSIDRAIAEIKASCTLITIVRTKTRLPKRPAGYHASLDSSQLNQDNNV